MPGESAHDCVADGRCGLLFSPTAPSVTGMATPEKQVEATLMASPESILSEVSAEGSPRRVRSGARGARLGTGSPSWASVASAGASDHSPVKPPDHSALIPNHIYEEAKDGSGDADKAAAGPAYSTDVGAKHASLDAVTALCGDQDGNDALQGTDSVNIADVRGITSSGAGGPPRTSGSGDGKATAVQRLRDPLVWLDLEMTGLDSSRHHVVEVACVITDGSLESAVEGPSLVIHQPEEVLADMNEWCREHHEESGLIEKIRTSDTSLRGAETALLAFVSAYTKKGKAVMAGNTVGVDAQFIQVHMPELAGWFSHRVVDVSSVAELAKRWIPREYHRRPKKVGRHRAMEDVYESIEELRHYQSTVFRRAPQRGEAARARGTGRRRGKPQGGRGDARKSSQRVESTKDRSTSSASGRGRKV